MTTCCTMSCALICFSVLIVIIAILLYDSQYKESSFQNKSPPLTAFQVIDARKFALFDIQSDQTTEYHGQLSERVLIKHISSSSDMDQLVIDIVHGKQPVVVGSSKVSKWGLLTLDLWNLSAQAWPILESVISIDAGGNESDVDRTILIEEEIDRGGMIFNSMSRRSQATTVEDMYSANFFFGLKNKSLCRFYSTNYRVMESLAHMEQESTWSDFRIIERNTILKNLSATQLSPLLNMLYPGCNLQARYAEHHIFRVQLQGVGRYVLFAPSNAKDLYMFPSIHVSAFQSQVAFSDSSKYTLFPKFPKAKFMHAVLTKGQVLYVPPYWTVRSEARTLSVTLDVLSPSDDQISLSEAHFAALPFSDVSSKEKKIISSQVYLVHVLSRISGITSIAKYSKSLRTRFSQLFPSSSLFMQGSSFQCYRDNQKLHDEIVLKLNREKVEKTAQFIADILNDVKLDTGIRWMWLGNYVEQIARWAMSDPNMAVLFIKECLNIDSKLEIIEEVEGPATMVLDPQ